MAISGALLFGFVILHMLGNLQVFLGPEQLNAYGAVLRAVPELLWAARLGLLLLVVFHIVSAVKLALENKKARPVAYQHYEPNAASYASRTMVMSGFIVLAFVIYHLLHFTVQVEAVNLVGTNFESLKDNQNRHDVFAMVVTGFSSFWVSLFYVIGVGLLCFHLSHGLAAMFQSLGWRKREPYGKILERAAPIVAVLLFLGYVSIPLAVLLGYGKQ